MARIAGVDIPREKRTVIALTYIFGVGPTIAQQVCAATGVDEECLVAGLDQGAGAETIGARDRHAGPEQCHAEVARH